MNYNKTYVQLIEHAKSRTLTRKDCYIEEHHIIPLSEGGPDCKSNLVALTAREHYVAHLLLAKIYNDVAMYAAVMFMQTGRHKNRNFKFNSHLYAKLRIEFGKRTSIEQKGKHTGEKNPMYGKSIFDFMSDEKIASWRVKNRKANARRRGKPSGMKGKHQSEESKSMISSTMSKLYWWTNGEISIRSIECPGQDFRRGRMKLTKEWRNKIKANAPKGKNHPWYGRHHTEESREKMSLKAKQWNTGRHWYTNGNEEVFTNECPDGFYSGRIHCSKRKSK